MQSSGQQGRADGRGPGEDLMTPPLGTLEYLYVGTADFDRDCAYYANVLGAERVWAFNAFGARVAAFRVCQGPLLLLADHRPAPGCMPVLAVADLNATVKELLARGRRSRFPTAPATASRTPAATPSPCSRTTAPRRWNGPTQTPTTQRP